ncbi:MAG TPA: hypothetical protein EYP20_06475 [Aigarchaeota archaeon]|nr:hypothetical protein [Aigarchaeota archaeon]
MERRYAEANMYLALIRRLYILLIDEKRKSTNILGSDKAVIYDLSCLPSIYLKTIYAVAILTRIYKESIAGTGLDRLIIAEGLPSQTNIALLRWLCSF